MYSDSLKHMIYDSSVQIILLGTEAAERFETWGAHRTQSQAHTSRRLLVFSKMPFVLFVCTNKLPSCNVYSVQCVRNRLMTMQEEAVVWTILIHGASKVGF